MRGAAIESLHLRILDRTNILRKRRSFRSISLLLALAPILFADIIDRIAVSVGNRVITISDIDRETRVTAFINGVKADLTPAGKRATAERLVEQKLIQRELETSRYPDAAELQIE